MKNATEFVKKFKKFRKSLPASDTLVNKGGAVHEIIYSSMLWNATSKQASGAYKKLIKSAVDLNEIRVNVIPETIDLIGSNYPQAFERSKRLRTVLNAIYSREHCMEITSIESAGKRDVREYFETLSGITPFVCNRVISLQYGVAAIPIDDRTLAALSLNGIISEDADIREAASWIGRQVKAEDVCGIHAQLHDWMSSQPARAILKSVTKKNTKSVSEPSKSRTATKKKVVKKSKKKSTSKKKVVKKVNKKTVSKKKVVKKTKK